MEPVIYLEGYNINKIKYEHIENADSQVFKDEPDFTFNFGLTEDLTGGLVNIIVEYFEASVSRYIYVDASGVFKLNLNDFDETSVKNHLMQNGSAILFPYIRSIISMISTLDGPSAIILPTLNMVDEMKKQLEK